MYQSLSAPPGAVELLSSTISCPVMCARDFASLVWRGGTRGIFLGQDRIRKRVVSAVLNFLSTA